MRKTKMRHITGLTTVQKSTLPSILSCSTLKAPQLSRFIAPPIIEIFKLIHCLLLTLLKAWVKVTIKTLFLSLMNRIVLTH
jgi:hypothetical protein